MRTQTEIKVDIDEITALSTQFSALERSLGARQRQGDISVNDDLQVIKAGASELTKHVGNLTAELRVRAALDVLNAQP